MTNRSAAITIGLRNVPEAESVVAMDVLDELIPLIDNGGTRSGSERRHRIKLKESLDRRNLRDRRSGADRRRTVNSKRPEGVERRTVFSESGEDDA